MRLSAFSSLAGKSREGKDFPNKENRTRTHVKRVRVVIAIDCSIDD